MKKPLTPDEALYRAAALCSTAERCANEIEEKLAGWGIPPTAASGIIEHLKREGYIDEARYCRSYVHDKIRFDRWGRLKIAAALRQKKISGEAIADALSHIDEEAYRAGLHELLDRKRQQLGDTGNPSERAKLVRFALSRGFEPGIVFPICGENDHETSYDD